jgi:hypothetical protein
MRAFLGQLGPQSPTWPLKRPDADAAARPSSDPARTQVRAHGFLGARVFIWGEICDSSASSMALRPGTVGHLYTRPSVNSRRKALT